MGIQYFQGSFQLMNSLNYKCKYIVTQDAMCSNVLSHSTLCSNEEQLLAHWLRWPFTHSSWYWTWTPVMLFDNGLNLIKKKFIKSCFSCQTSKNWYDQLIVPDSWLQDKQIKGPKGHLKKWFLTLHDFGLYSGVKLPVYERAVLALHPSSRKVSLPEDVPALTISPMLGAFFHSLTCTQPIRCRTFPSL